MKEKLLIADCLRKYDDKGNPFGHYITVFEQYYQILQDDFEVSLGVTKEYKKKINFCDRFFTIRFGINYSKTYNRLDKYFSLVKEMLNVIMVLNSKYNIIIFQQTNFIFSLNPLIFYFGKKKIFFIIYKDYLNSSGKIKRLLKRLIYGLAKKKIRGLILGIEKLSNIYKHNYLILPDYVFTNKYYNSNNIPIMYDIAILGIITNSKNIYDVLSSFYNTKYKIIIAGIFKDNEQYKKVYKFKADNITIINDYLSRERYDDILQSTKFVALPYNPTIYKLSSSGVFYEAIYHFKPVITSNTEFFKRVEENKIGYVYKHSIKEYIHILNNSKIYNDYVRNIKNYVKKINKDNKDRLISLLH